MSGTSLTQVARMAGWKTPCVPNGGRISGNAEDIGKHQDGTKAQIGLENEAKLTAWGTPAARDWKNGDSSQETLDKNARRRAAAAERLADPPIVTRENDSQVSESTYLGREAQLSSWNTPRTRCGEEGERGGRSTERIGGCKLNRAARLTASLGDQADWVLTRPQRVGDRPGSHGQLNAAHSRWLMGLPSAWDDCGVMAMESLRRLRKRSSKRTLL